jgi:hypothetical protein
LTRVGSTGEAVTAGGVQAVGGHVTIEADHGSAAAWTMGNVTVGNPPQPGTHQR